MSNALKAHLFARYGSFADKRIKNLEKSRRFIADSRDRGDFASDGSLYGWFCSIFVDVVSDDEVNIILSGDIPDSPNVNEILSNLGGTLGGPHYAPRMQLTVTKRDLRMLRKLAAEVDSIVAPGRRYSTPSYKYMCPRTASSLRDLAKYLEEFWE